MNYYVKKAITWFCVLIVAFAIFAATLVGFGRYGISGYMDACFVPGVVIIAIGLLMMLARQGTFDIFAYGFISMGNSFSKDPTERKYQDFTDYSEKKNEKRVNHQPSYDAYFAIGGIFLLISIILLLIQNYA